MKYINNMKIGDIVILLDNIGWFFKKGDKCIITNIHCEDCSKYMYHVRRLYKNERWEFCAEDKQLKTIS